MHIRRAPLALLVALGLLLGACAPVTATQPPSVAADVNGDAVPVSAVTEQYEALVELPELAQEIELQEGLREQVEAVLVSLLIQRELFRQGAEGLGVEVDEGDVEERVVAQAGTDDPEELREAFALQGITPEFARLQAEIQLYQERAGEELAGQGELTDEELQTAYEQLYTAAPSARHILLDTEEEAEEVLERLEAGEDFGELAVGVSTDPSAEQNEGELGPITAEQFDPDFAEAVFEAEDGEIVGPVETQFGYHVIERLTPPELAEVEDEVRAAAEADRDDLAIETWVTGLLEDSEVEVNPRFGAWSAEIGQVEPTSPLDRPSPLER